MVPAADVVVVALVVLDHLASLPPLILALDPNQTEQKKREKSKKKARKDNKGQ